MNNYYSLIYLTKHLKNKCVGAKYTYGYSPHKNVWEGFFKAEDGEFRIIFSADSRETAIFTDSYRNPKKANVTTFFDVLTENIIKEIILADGDRWLTLIFQSGDELLFQLFGNTPNIFHITDNRIKESFKAPEQHEGNEKPSPRESRPIPELQPSWNAKTVITKTDPKFPRHFINFLIDHYELSSKPQQFIRDLTLKLSGQMRNNPEFRVLQNGNLCLISRENLPFEEIKLFDTCNEAVRFTYYKTSRERRLSKRIESIKPRLEGAIDKAKRTISQLENADKALKRSDKYENYGHILMAHAHEKVQNGSESVTLPDFYNDNEPVTISIKPTQTIAENAQRYYEKASKAKKRVTESKKRMKRLQKDLEELQQVHQSFRNLDKIYEFDGWLDDHKEQLNRLGVLSQNQQTETLPFRRAEIDGYEIWIGKNAKSNDKLTAQAHKEDVWLHARGVGGSHVVIRMNNTKEYPPRHVLLKTASVAAWNSKAKGTKLAPVIVTKRKYVSNPKGAPAGTVRVHREEVEMVEPKKLSEWTN